MSELRSRTAGSSPSTDHRQDDAELNRAANAALEAIGGRVEALEKALWEIIDLNDNASHDSADRDFLRAGQIARDALRESR